MADMGGTEFGEALREDAFLAENMRKPQGHRAGDLDLHQDVARIEELFALGFALEPDVLIAGYDLAVEGDPQLGVVVADQREAAVADVCLREQSVAADHVVDLDRDVADQMLGQFAGADVAVGFVTGH